MAIAIPKPRRQSSLARGGQSSLARGGQRVVGGWMNNVMNATAQTIDMCQLQQERCQEGGLFGLCVCWWLVVAWIWWLVLLAAESSCSLGIFLHGVSHHLNPRFVICPFPILRESNDGSTFGPAFSPPTGLLFWGKKLWTSSSFFTKIGQHI
jgi:hypothetical protein